MSYGAIPIREAIRMLGVDRRTLWQWGRNGKLSVQRDYRGWRFFQADEVKALKNKFDQLRVNAA